MVARNLLLAVGAAALVGGNAFVAPMAGSVTVRSSTRTNMSVERQVDKAGDAIKDAGRDAKSAAKDVGNKAQNALDDLKGDAKDATRKAEREGDSLGSKAKSAIDDAASSAKSAIRDAKGSGKDLADDAERNVKNAADDVENNADGLGSKIKHAAGDVKDAVGDAANAIKHKALWSDRCTLSSFSLSCARLTAYPTLLCAAVIATTIQVQAKTEALRNSRMMLFYGSGVVTLHNI
eukprot:5866-Heterococcus_DN1.PRE.6